MIDPIHYSGCIFDEDGYFYQNGEGEEYAANPFTDEDECSREEEE